MSSKYIFFLGHQPHIGLAELEAVFSNKSIQFVADNYAILELDQEPNINLLGGTTKISKLLKSEELSSNLEDQVKILILGHLTEQQISKVKLGLSIYSGKSSDQLSKKTAQKILKSVQKANENIKIRTVLPYLNELSTAQIIHSDLLKAKGLSLDVIVHNSELILAQTLQVPNLKKYTLRDYGKPKPSGSNGMLPPKLAQILLNLSELKTGQTVLDPFCGSGTVLQEALLRDINCVGTDLNPNIVEDAKLNLSWLIKKFKLNPELKLSLNAADATNHRWAQQFDAVVCEVFLGKALSKTPTDQALENIKTECNTIAEGFLTNLLPQLGSFTPVVIALPCWNFGREIIKLPVVENLSSLGYNQKKSKKVSKDLVYLRQSGPRSQFVGRDIYILTKKK